MGTGEIIAKGNQFPIVFAGGGGGGGGGEGGVSNTFSHNQKSAAV